MSVKQALCIIFASVFITILCIGPSSADICSSVHRDASLLRQSDVNYRNRMAKYGNKCFLEDRDRGQSDYYTVSRTRCNSTPGYIEWVKDTGSGHNLCVFEPPSNNAVTQRGKSQAQEPLQNLSTPQKEAQSEIDFYNSYEESCINWLKDGDTEAAIACYRHFASIEYRTCNYKSSCDNFDERSAYFLAEAERLETSIVQSKPDPDPNRVVETAACSSKTLGDLKSLFDAPIPVGSSHFSFGLMSPYPKKVLAAIETTNSGGQCIRQVIYISPDDPPFGAAGATVFSVTEPIVFDAVPYLSNDTATCYRRRHHNISCDGKTNYN